MTDISYEGMEPVPDGYAIVVYPGFPFLDDILGEKREIVSFFGQCRVGDFFDSPNHPIGEVKVVTWDYEEAVEMYNATDSIRFPLIRLIGKLVSGA